jgi:hypothetical protein
VLANAAVEASTAAATCSTTRGPRLLRRARPRENHSRCDAHDGATSATAATSGAAGAVIGLAPGDGWV